MLKLSKLALLALITCLTTGCIPEEPYVPTKAVCDIGGWKVDPVTFEILVNEEGAAIECLLL